MKKESAFVGMPEGKKLISQADLKK